MALNSQPVCPASRLGRKLNPCERNCIGFDRLVELAGQHLHFWACSQARAGQQPTWQPNRVKSHANRLLESQKTHQTSRDETSRVQSSQSEPANRGELTMQSASVLPDPPESSLALLLGIFIQHHNSSFALYCFAEALLFLTSSSLLACWLVVMATLLLVP